jgi:4-hydroxy-4-methyl-2-oxoglutarate aldolase
MKHSLSLEQLEALRGLDGCTVANAIETFHERLLNDDYVDGSVRCLFPHLPPMVGRAVTIKIRGSSPPMAGRQYLHRTDWWDYILSVPSPRVVVVQDAGRRLGAGSLVGVVHMNILRRLQCAGVVTNGSARDIPAAAAKITAKNRKLIAICQSADFSLEKLRVEVLAQKF